ncbi:MAG: hypothetical protein J7K26_03795 [Candidatus Aenigmarchaeota archaeon]|nr:hypothetical protein [Candidatus Aenigmarchaeota archaeon]
MKGQYLTVEYVIFFAIGISLVIGIYFTFNDINSKLKDTALQGQIDRVSEMIRSNIIRIYYGAKNTNSNIKYEINIPPKLSGSIYTIRILENGLNINSTDNYNIGKILNLYNINIESDGIIYSTRGKINIIANKDGVVLS